MKSDWRFYVKLSKGDGTFLAGPEGKTNITADCFGFADINGDGLDDMIGTSAGAWPYVDIYLRLNTGEAMPNVLTAATDIQGARTEFTYLPSTMHTNALLPFSFPTLSKLRIDDGLGNIAETRFDYEGGRFDPEDREFRGFERIERTQPDGSRLITRFHQDRFRRGKAYQVDLMPPGESADPGVRTSLEWEPDISSDPGARYAFVRLARKKTEYLDMDPVFYQEDCSYDAQTGNLTRLARSGNAGEVIGEVITENAYQNFGVWCWKRTRETLREKNHEVVRDTAFAYQPGTGNLHMIRYHFNGASNQVEYRYDAYGNPVEYLDAAGNAPWVAAYDSSAHRFPVEIINPSGHTMRSTWDLRYGRKTSQTDANQNVTSYGYDPFGRETSISYPDQGQVLREYDECLDSACTEARVPRRVLQKRRERPNEDRFILAHEYFDGLGRSVQKISFGENGRPIVTKTHYDAMGRKYLSEGPFFGAEIGYPVPSPGDCPYRETEYDYRGRPIRLHAPLGESAGPVKQATTIIAYSGYTKTTTDPDGARKTEIFDCFDRRIQVRQSLEERPIVTSYRYNGAGDLLSATNAGGITTTFGYDGLGRKKSMNDPDLGQWFYDYDANNNLIATHNARGHSIQLGYDALNRMVSKKYSNSDPAVSCQYDHPSIPNGIGRLYKIENANAATVYKAYDKMGRVSRVSRRIAGAPQPEYDTAYTYDIAGRLTGMGYPDQYQVSFAYHAGTELLRVIAGEADSGELAEIDSYTPANQMGFIYHGNGCATAYGYDNASGRLVSVRTQDPSLSDIQSRTYSFSAAGDLLRVTSADGSGARTYQYAYDELHRLIQETNNASSESFKPAVFDTAYDTTLPLHAPKTASAAGGNYAFEYDANGNMTTGYDFSDPRQAATRKIEFNADNLPTTIAYRGSGAAKIMKLDYDGEGRRVKKSIMGGETTYYVGDHYEITGGTATKYVFAGGLRLARLSGSTPLFYHKDHLGSSTALTAWSDGKPLETAEYLPFGLLRRHTGARGMKYTFTDHESDAGSGLYNFKARLYDPALGIFISPDSVVPDFANPQSLNRYSYCYNNPLIYTDPDGHWVVGATVGALSGGLSGLMAGIALGGENLDAAIYGGIGGAVIGALVGGGLGAIGLSSSSSTTAVVAVNALSGMLGSVAGNQTSKGITAGYLASKSGSETPFAEGLTAALDVNGFELGAVALSGAISGAAGGLATVAVGTAPGAELAVSLATGLIDPALGLLSGVASNISSSDSIDAVSGNTVSVSPDDGLGDLGLIP